MRISVWRTWRRRARRGPTLQGRLLQLVFVVSLPLFLLGGASAWFVYAGERSRAEDRVRSQTWNMALVVDQQFARAETLLEALGTSNSLAAGDLAGFRSEAMAASAVFDNAPISLMTADHRVVLNTGCARSQPCSEPTELLADTLNGGRARISNLVRDGPDGGYQVAIAVPVGSLAPQGSARASGGYALCLTLPPGLIAGALKEQHLPPSWIVTVLDRDGEIAARTTGERETLGQHLAPELLAAIARAPIGLIHGLRTLKGVPAVMAFARAPRSGVRGSRQHSRVDVPIVAVGGFDAYLPHRIRPADGRAGDGVRLRPPDFHGA